MHRVEEHRERLAVMKALAPFALRRLITPRCKMRAFIGLSHHCAQNGRPLLQLHGCERESGDGSARGARARAERLS